MYQQLTSRIWLGTSFSHEQITSIKVYVGGEPFVVRSRIVMVAYRRCQDCQSPQQQPVKFALHQRNAHQTVSRIIQCDVRNRIEGILKPYTKPAPNESVTIHWGFATHWYIDPCVNSQAMKAKIAMCCNSQSAILVSQSNQVHLNNTTTISTTSGVSLTCWHRWQSSGWLFNRTGVHAPNSMNSLTRTNRSIYGKFRWMHPT